MLSFVVSTNFTIPPVRERRIPAIPASSPDIDGDTPLAGGALSLAFGSSDALTELFGSFEQTLREEERDLSVPFGEVRSQRVPATAPKPELKRAGAGQMPARRWRSVAPRAALELSPRHGAAARAAGCR